MNTNERFWKVTTIFVGVLIALAAIFVVKEIKLIGAVGRNPNQTNTINVDGTGDALTVPDIATFSFSVTENAKTVADAQAAATKKINAALQAVKDAGVAEKDISTQSYTINPHYEYHNAICPTSVSASYAAAPALYCPSGKSVLTGYDVSQSIQVKVRDLAKAGAIFTTIGSLGVQNVDALTFSVDKPEAVQAEARAKAIADAQNKADQLARQLGVHLVRIISFSENNGGYYGRVSYAASANLMKDQAMSPVPPAIPTGEQKVTSNVSITYEIE